MKKCKGLFILLLIILASCNNDDVRFPSEDKVGSNDVRVDSRDKFLSVSDLVLLYGGATFRSVSWNMERLAPYVTYKDSLNKEHWLFDGFLLSEFAVGSNEVIEKMFVKNDTNRIPANKNDWKNLLDYYLAPGNMISQLDKTVEAASARIGKPEEKRKVILVIPEPINPRGQAPGRPWDIEYNVPNDYWGDLNGVTLDLTKDEDRITACKWYIDYAIDAFNKGKYKNIELAGFYWLPEILTFTTTILPEIGKYLNDRMYTFNWIPYFKNEDKGYTDWKKFKFNYAYLQPNYGVKEILPQSRLEEACGDASTYDLDLEFEFNQNLLSYNDKEGIWSKRLYEYMKAYRDNDMLGTKRIAYYQGVNLIYLLARKESSAKDKKHYNDICLFVLEHAAEYKKMKSH